MHRNSLATVLKRHVRPRTLSYSGIYSRSKLRKKKEWSETIKTAKNNFMNEVTKTDGYNWGNEELDGEEKKMDSGKEL